MLRPEVRTRSPDSDAGKELVDALRELGEGRWGEGCPGCAVGSAQRLQGVPAVFGGEVDQCGAGWVALAVAVAAGGAELPGAGFGSAQHRRDGLGVGGFDPAAGQPLLQLLPGEPGLPTLRGFGQQF